MVATGDHAAGAFARHPIVANETVVVIPKQLLMEHDAVHRDPIVQTIVARSTSNVPTRTLLAVAILEHRRRHHCHDSAGSISNDTTIGFGPFTAALPQTFWQLPQLFDTAQVIASSLYRLVNCSFLSTHPDLFRCCCCDDQFAQLDGSTLSRHVKQSNSTEVKAYSRLCKLAPTFCHHHSLYDFIWAKCNVHSRAFGLRIREPGIADHSSAQSVMIPLVDMLNHRRNPNLRWRFDPERQAAVLDAVRDVAVGQELTSPYGHRTSQHYFQSYGFVPTGQPVAEGAPGNLCQCRGQRMQ